MKTPSPVATAALAALIGSFALPAAPAQLHAQALPIVGSWSGELDVQNTRLPLIFHITADGATLSATMDSPLQGARGMPVDSVRFMDGTVTMRLLAINGTYTGRLVEPDVIEGEWRQGPGVLPLTLRRGDAAAAEPRRPQHPEPPFPYRSEEVRFSNDAAGISLGGTLTLPQGTGPFPAVALVTGSGPQDRDETILGHKPFLVISDHLTRAGIAVLRYDDRGVGASQGDFAAATTRDFAGDAAAAAAFLKTRPEVDPARVGLIGHSEGGLIAPMVATGAAGAPRADLAFVVLLAGPALPGDEILRLQADAITRASGAAPEQVEAVLRGQRRMLEAIRAEADDQRRRQRLREVMLAELDSMAPEERVQQGIAAGSEAAWVDAQIATAGTAWYREFILLDPRPVLRQLRIPTLALFGSLDLQVPPAQNENEMRAALDNAGNPDFSVLTLPGLNHLFQTARTGAPAEYGSIEETFAPAVLHAMTNWILERFGGRVLK